MKSNSSVVTPLPSVPLRMQHENLLAQFCCCCCWAAKPGNLKKKLLNKKISTNRDKQRIVWYFWHWLMANGGSRFAQQWSKIHIRRFALMFCAPTCWWRRRAKTTYRVLLKMTVWSFKLFLRTVGLQLSTSSHTKTFAYLLSIYSRFEGFSPFINSFIIE